LWMLQAHGSFGRHPLSPESHDDAASLSSMRENLIL
jgi:hypothetical protein